MSRISNMTPAEKVAEKALLDWTLCYRVWDFADDAERRISSFVAEHVFGYSINRGEIQGNGRPYYEVWIDRAEVTHNPISFLHVASDYLVLAHVREHWAETDGEGPLQWDFYLALESMWLERNDQYTLMSYQPGDYSKAALKSLGVEV